MLGLSGSVLVKQGWNAFLCDEMHSPGINCVVIRDGRQGLYVFSDGFPEGF